MEGLIALGASRDLHHEITFSRRSHTALLLCQHGFVINRTTDTELQVGDTPGGALLQSGVLLLRETHGADQPTYKVILLSLFCDIRSFNPSAPGLTYDLVTNHDHILQTIRACIPLQIGDGTGAESLHDLWDYLGSRVTVQCIKRIFSRDGLTCELIDYKLPHGPLIELGTMWMDAPPANESQRVRKKLANVVSCLSLGTLTIPHMFQLLYHAGALSHLGPRDHAHAFPDDQMVPVSQEH